MIDFRSIERKKDQLRELFNSRSVEHVVIDDFISVDSIENLLGEIPDPVEAGLRKSRDYIFAKNKYEKSDFSDYGSSLKGAQRRPALCAISQISFVYNRRRRFCGL